MQRAIDETERRRRKQLAFNEAHGITPKTVEKSVADIMETAVPGGGAIARRYQRVAEGQGEYEVPLDPLAAAREIKRLEKEMHALARELKFEEAARVRDRLRELQGKAFVA